jgi:hypothetical protein
MPPGYRFVSLFGKSLPYIALGSSAQASNIECTSEGCAGEPDWAPYMEFHRRRRLAQLRGLNYADRCEMGDPERCAILLAPG